MKSHNSNLVLDPPALQESLERTQDQCPGRLALHILLLHERKSQLLNSKVALSHDKASFFA